MRFITFHQSYSYEDFIEGYRPNIDNNGNLEIKLGIFRQICENAQKNLDNSKIDESKKEIDFEKLFYEFSQAINDKLVEGEYQLLDEGYTIKEIRDNGSFIIGGKVTSSKTVTKDVLETYYPLFKENKIKSFKDIQPSYNSKKTYHGNARYYYMVLDALKTFEDKLDDTNKKDILNKKEELKNFYLVIDEINRGNISKIFGELITLIEDNKRDNKDYEVILPYSNEPFLIPSNLYIIATMNTSDKSIASIDVALRRRFTFLKMEPKDDLVTDNNAKDLFTRLNKHIGETLGEDYLLGHSYFMGEGVDLDFVKKYKIKPLLEEYFYADDKNLKEAIKILNGIQE